MKTINGRPQLQLTEGHARELAGFLVERCVAAETLLHPRFGWLAITWTPWHDGAVFLRSWEDVFALLTEMSYTGAWSGDIGDAGDGDA